MILGFTGTRNGMTAAQKDAIIEFLRLNTPEMALHGDCIGADASFHWLLPKTTQVLIHPGGGLDHPLRAGCAASVIHPVKPFLERNHDIVDACDHLLACPGETTEQTRSGTWATIRFARKVGKPLTIVWLDGTVTKENQ